MDIAEWSRLLTAVQEIQEWFPEGVAYIGSPFLRTPARKQRQPNTPA
jgi:hypothetical protein